MPKPFETWTVLPHGKLGAVDERILSVIGELHMPFGDVSRRMTVVRLRDGRLVTARSRCTKPRCCSSRRSASRGR